MVDRLSGAGRSSAALMATCTLPVLPQVLLVRTRPLEDEPERPRRNPARDHHEALDVDRRLVVSVTRMKMCSPVVVDLVVVHPDHDPVEGTYSRHPAIVPDSPDSRGALAPKETDGQRLPIIADGRAQTRARDCFAPRAIRRAAADGTTPLWPEGVGVMRKAPDPIARLGHTGACASDGRVNDGRPSRESNACTVASVGRGARFQASGLSASLPLTISGCYRPAGGRGASTLGAPRATPPRAWGRPGAPRWVLSTPSRDARSQPGERSGYPTQAIAATRARSPRRSCRRGTT